MPPPQYPTSLKNFQSPINNEDIALSQTNEVENALNFHCQCKCHLVENYGNCQCSCDDKLSKCSEIGEEDCENIDIVSIIKFCNQNKQIVFPAQVFFFLYTNKSYKLNFSMKNKRSKS